MSVSIYYTATRSTSLTARERADLDKLIDKHNATFPYDYEELSLYDRDDPNQLLEGATKLPSDAVKSLVSIRHWCGALTQLRRLLPDAEWDVHMDDYQIPWSHDEGFALPGIDEAIEFARSQNQG